MNEVDSCIQCGRPFNDAHIRTSYSKGEIWRWMRCAYRLRVHMTPGRLHTATLQSNSERHVGVCLYAG